MMKRYSKIYLATFFIVNLVYMLLVFIARRHVQDIFPFLRLETAIILISIFIALAVWIFKLEKGNSIVNVIIGYLIILPVLLIARREFGPVFFRFSWVIYILMIIIGIIYGIVVFVVSKKYKDEVTELNQLLEEKQHEDNSKKE